MCFGGFRRSWSIGAADFSRRGSTRRLKRRRFIVDEPLLDINNLKVYYPIFKGSLFKREKVNIKAVDGIDLKIRRGEVIGLVGESGCGKLLIARALMFL